MTAQRVLEVARSQLGTVESPPNSNRTPYGRAYGMDGAAWCAMFTWWCFQQAGVGGLVPKSAYTPAIADWYRTRKQWGAAPRPGALVLFDFPGDGVNRISHIGIVEAVNANGSIVTIEGNTSPGTSGSQRDGGGVFRRTRASGIVGYGYPAYPASSAASAAAPTSSTSAALEDDLMASIPITPDQVGRFHAAVGAEAGGGSRVASEGFVTWGSTYGGTTWTVAALAEDGRVLAYWPDIRTGNNKSTSRALPAGTRCITTEGQADNAGTRPWASYWGLR